MIDPYNFLKAGMPERHMASQLLEGQSVPAPNNYIEILLKKSCIEGLPQKEDVVIFGSSRSKKIHSHLFKRKYFFNASIGMATLEDYLALYGIFRKKNKDPGVMVLELSPWIFNKNTYESDWKWIRSDYDYTARLVVPNYHTKIGIDMVIPRKYLEIASVPYFHASFFYFIHHLTNFRKLQTRDEHPSGILKPDGTTDAKMKPVDVKQVRTVAKAYVYTNMMFGMEHFTQMDPKAISTFKNFIGLLSQDGVKLVFYLPPYHPQTYEEFAKNQQYHVLYQIEEYVRTFARSKQIQVVGGYNPSSCGIREEDFDDAIHLNTKGIDKLFKSHKG